jgi:predicted house-cleaning noncanonical NTP pyrophosphatase (MazG superfamily)
VSEPYRKLVRDNIPRLIRESGETPITRRLDDEEYTVELNRKLGEEYEEYREAASTERSVQELVDMVTVIDALAVHLVGRERYEQIRAEKAAERGEFEERVYLEGVEEEPDGLA